MMAYFPPGELRHRQKLPGASGQHGKYSQMPPAKQPGIILGIGFQDHVMDHHNLVFLPDRRHVTEINQQIPFDTQGQLQLLPEMSLQDKFIVNGDFLERVAVLGQNPARHQNLTAKASIWPPCQQAIQMPQHFKGISLLPGHFLGHEPAIYIYDFIHQRSLVLIWYCGRPAANSCHFSWQYCRNWPLKLAAENFSAWLRQAR